MIRAHHFLLVLLSVLGLAAAVLLVPRPEERVTMLLRDGNFEDALREVTELQQRGVARPALDMVLFKIHRQAGRSAPALAALTRYIAAEPANVDALVTLAGMQRDMLMPIELMETLDRLVTLRKDRKDVRELLGLYRLHGRFESELLLVRQLAKTSLVTPQDLDRAARALARTSRHAEAIDLLRLADERLAPEGTDQRLLLFVLLAENGRADEAVRRGAKWIANWRAPFRAVDLAHKLVHAGHADKVIDLAEQAGSTVPGIEFDLIGALNQVGRQDVTARMLVTWSDKLATAAPGALDRFVVASAKAGAHYSLLSGMTSLVAAGHTVQAGLLADRIARNVGLDALWPIRSMLTAEVLEQVPMLAAEISMAEGNALAARRHLLSAAGSGRIEAALTGRWIEMTLRTNSAREAFAVLSAKANTGTLPKQLVVPLATLAAHLGQWHVHRAMTALALSPS